MTTPNPLMPQGSFESQAGNKRSMIKIVVSTILAVHGVVLGGLLFLGCKEESPDSRADEYDASGMAELEPITQNPDYDPFEGVVPDDGQPLIPEDTNAFAGLGPGDSLPPFGETDGEQLDGTGQPPLPDGFEPGGPRPGGQPLIDPAVEPPEPSAPRSYVVATGDSFYSIAKDHGIKMSEVQAANPGINPNRLQIGQTINLPPDVEPQTPAIPEDNVGGPEPIIHTVKSGDTLYRLADKYGITLKELQEANGIRGSTIRVGQKLLIPLPQ